MIVDAEKLSNGMIVLILIYALLGGSCLAARFWQRHPAHLLWTVPVGFLAAFVFAAICVAIGEVALAIGCCVSAAAMVFFIVKPIAPKNPPAATALPSSDLDAIQQQQAKLEQEIVRLNQIIQANVSPEPHHARSVTLPECGATVQFSYENDKDEPRCYVVKVSSIDGTYLHGRDVDRDLNRTFQRNRIVNGEVRDCDSGEVFFL